MGSGVTFLSARRELPMTQQVFDAEIGLYEKELYEIIDKMEKTREAFVSATVACLQKWYLEKARLFAQNQYQLTNKMGLAKLSEMKARIAKLVANAPTDAQKFLGDDKLWWHRSRGGGWQDHYTPGPPDGLKMAVEALADKLTSVLEAHGYIKKVVRPKEEATGAGPSGKSRAAKIPAPPELEWTEAMNKYVNAYKEDLGRATFLDGKMQLAKKRKEKHIAGLLWDKA